MDGMPIALHDPDTRTRQTGHVLLAPAGRVEAIVSGPAAGTPQHLMTRCVDTGTDGDPNPAMILADIVPRSGADSTSNISESTVIPEVKKVDLAAEEEAPPPFVLTVTEDKDGFLLHREKIALDSVP